MTKKLFIEDLAGKNRAFYGTSEGRGVLRAFDLTFEHRWLYLFELIQNALDAGACSIKFGPNEDSDSFVFQHNGNLPLDEKAIEALSKVFRSTKGASSTGFMGVGFKSVFRQFLEAKISGWEWTFRYEITQSIGKRYGDIQPDLLGAVIPIWDDTVPAPEEGFTTRFELHKVDGEAVLKSDLEHFLPDDNDALLAILAAHGLKRLEADSCVWRLGISDESDGTLLAEAHSEEWNRNWQLFPVDFDPSKKAIASLIEHRRLQISDDEREQTNAEVARTRRVLGILPLDPDGTPAPPARGRVYATLPTETTLPFGLHINADWLLNISRVGLGEIEDNPWQRETADRIADVLSDFLGWTSRTFSEPTAAKAAFKVLALPLTEAGGLEAFLAEERWLSKLRTRLEDKAVLPVWAEAADALAFAKPSDTIVPPRPLARKFKELPGLRPAVLLKGPVLINEVLGYGARHLLRRIGLLDEMLPKALERAWSDGLAKWWETLADDQKERQALLFRIWAAVAELTSEAPWQNIDLPCVRTATGQWLPVDKVVLFDEPFPSQREPGGAQVREFLQRFIPDTERLPSNWIKALREGAKEEDQHETLLSRTQKWIERSTQRISLREVVESAMNELDSSPTPDWSVLIPLGHWAKHRNRTDLLTQILVGSESDPSSVPVDEALLADPYVEDRQGRRRLFPGNPAVSAVYLEQDPKKADAGEWRTFFEQVGVKGKLEVRLVKEHVSRYDRRSVAEFLDLDISRISESNSRGYELIDYEIEPEIPSPDASEELRTLLADWLEDGRDALQNKGMRQVKYTYYYQFTENGKSSSWVTKLNDLAWVPCDDGTLRHPKDVLPSLDPGREDAPVAKLSPELLRLLEQEGVEFGAAIPEAPALRKLEVVGSRFDAEELAQLLRECREQITEDRDRRHFVTVLQALTVPTENSQRVPLDRIVQQVTRKRGTLGNWLVPLNRISEALRVELEHSDFPYKFPDTTTGKQALSYIRDVWESAQSSSEGLANKVRDVLPVAYAYCLDDCDQDTSLARRWRASIPEAAVFAEREWVVLDGNIDICLDDINDHRFLPEKMQLRTATGGHLGDSMRAQIRTAKALDIRLLSSSIKMEWYGENEALPIDNNSINGFNLICQLLRWVRGRGAERAKTDEAGVDTGVELRLKHVRKLGLRVSTEGTSAENVPVNARLSGAVLTVAGRPVEFGSDAAKELVRHFSFGQRADLAADLTGMLAAIDNPSDFFLAVNKFWRSFARGFDLPAKFQRGSDVGNTAGLVNVPARAEDPGSDDEKMAGRGPHSTRKLNNSTSRNDKSASTSSSYTKDRALARPNALAEKLKSASKGELVLDDDDDDPGEFTRPNRDSGIGFGDEEYRRAAAKYESMSGREPEFGDAHQTGWDIRSVDPQTGEIRLIEVKGKGYPWVKDEVVELSHAQVRKAFEASVDGKEHWYLYVVEKTGDGYQVLPVENPVLVADKWILCGKSWRMAAEAEARRDVSKSNCNR